MRVLTLYKQSRGEADTLALDDRNFDLVLLSNWEDHIITEPGQHVEPSADPARPADLMTPANQSLESGAWAQSIIWSPNAPFRDFTQLEFNFGEEQPQEERQSTIVFFYTHAGL